MAGNVWILGGYQSDFARNLTREGSDFAALTTEVVDLTLAESMIDATDIEVVHVANAFGELFARQGHLGRCRQPCTRDCGTSRPAGTRQRAHRAVSRSLAAMADLRAGNYDTALVVGLELEKTVPATPGLRYLGAAAWTGHEGCRAKFLWPSMFSEIADEYDRRFGIDEAHLHAIAALNFANARRNPNAQTRDWDVPDLKALGGDDEINPRTEGGSAATTAAR